MNRITNAIKWDAVLIYKYGIVTIAGAMAIIYSLVLMVSEIPDKEKLLTVVVFSDPVMYGFLFTAVMLLFEKDSNTHQALAVSPLSAKQYILSKATIFTILALTFSYIVAFAAQPEILHYLLFFIAIVFSSFLFVFIGIIGVSFVSNFNQFILLMPIVLAPTCLPFLSFFNLYNSWVFYLLPTQACLYLFEASFSEIENWKIVYALVYLLIWNMVCYYLSLNCYRKRIIKISSHE